MDIQQRMEAFAMLGAEWVMWLLVGLSVVCVAIILERIYYFATSRDDVREMQAALRKKLADDDVEGAQKALAAGNSITVKAVADAIALSDRGPEAVEERLAGERVLAKAEMERLLSFLGTVGNNAPFIGLLGTVIGIIQAFKQLDESAGQVTTGLMSTVGEALVATAIGILVALPAVGAYNYFQRVVKGRLNVLDALGHDALSYLRGDAEGEA